MKDPSVRVSIFRRVGRNDPREGTHGQQRITDDEVLFTKPTLLCCGGGGTLKGEDENESSRKANGFGKLGHMLLSFEGRVRKDDPIDILAVAYPENTDRKDASLENLMRNTLKNEPSYNKAADNLMYDYIKPLLLDARGKPKDIKQVKRILRNITILAHSYGGAFVRQLDHALKAELEELYPSKPEEIRDAMAQVLVVVGGTAAPLGGGGSFTTIDVLNSQDIITGQHLPGGSETQHKLIREMLRDNGKMHKEAKNIPAQALTVMPVRLDVDEKLQLLHEAKSRNLLIYAAQDVLKTTDCKTVIKPTFDKDMVRSDGRGSFLNVEVKPSEEEHDKTNHQVPVYFHFGAGTHGFMLRSVASCVLANGLNNAIQNQTSKTFKPLKEPMDLLKCPKQLHYPKAEMELKDEYGMYTIVNHDFTKIAKIADYNNRISAACCSKTRAI